MYVNLLRQKAYHRLTDDDMGKIIGRGGKIASSIRTIVKSLSAKTRKKVFVKFGE